jgi:hypothetical protein
MFAPHIAERMHSGDTCNVQRTSGLEVSFDIRRNGAEPDGDVLYHYGAFKDKFAIL